MVVDECAQRVEIGTADQFRCIQGRPGGEDRNSPERAPCAIVEQAGNTTTTPCVYLVAYLFLGFDSPLEVERLKSGSTIPVKFAFGDATGAPMSDAEGESLAAACAVRVSFTGGNPSPDCATYNPDADRFELRLKTAKGTLGMHSIGVRVLDGAVVLNDVSTQVFLVR